MSYRIYREGHKLRIEDDRESFICHGCPEGISLRLQTHTPANYPFVAPWIQPPDPVTTPEETAKRAQEFEQEKLRPYLARHPGSKYIRRSVVCPKCFAAIGKVCRSLGSGFPTCTHNERLELAYDMKGGHDGQSTDPIILASSD